MFKFFSLLDYRLTPPSHPSTAMPKKGNPEVAARQRLMVNFREALRESLDPGQPNFE